MDPINSIRFLFTRHKTFYRFIHNIFGQYPSNINLYKLALCHKSAAQEKIRGLRLSNERLEYLGDAVLSLIVADYLFRKFPLKDEGFLTEIRSRLVKRSYLNRLGYKLGLEEWIQSELNGSVSKSIYGNTLEALVGALYLDKGFSTAKSSVFTHIIEMHVDLDRLVNEDQNFKSRLIEWAQRTKTTLEFRNVEENKYKNGQEYKVEVIVGGKVMATALDHTIKGAEQLASEKAIARMDINNDENDDHRE